MNTAARSLSTLTGTSTAPSPKPKEDTARAHVAMKAMDEYFQGVIAERRRAPQADLISEMIRAQESGDRLSDDELLAPNCY